MKLNQKAVDFAKEMIDEGKYEGGDGDWSNHQPSTEDENKYIDEHGMEDYGKWFMGINEEDGKDEKGRYEFPYGDFKKVHRGGLIAAKQRAGQYDHPEIEKAAGDLMNLIEEKE